MKIVKTIISIISIILLRSFLFQQIHGLNTNIIELDQNIFKHEIFDISFDEEMIHFTGYAFVIERQHHRSTNTHTTYLEIINLKGESTLFQAQLHPSNYTKHMQYRGTSICSNTTYYAKNTTCYYDYEQVQFSVSVPLSHFSDEETYYFNVVIHLNQVKQSYKTQVYSLMNQNDYETSKHIFSFNHHQQPNQLKIIHSEVVVRNAPSIQGSTYYVGTYCSSTYKNQLFYQKDSIYNNVKSVFFNSDVGLSYYEIEGKLSTCINSRRTVIEGTNIKPMFINRFMVNLVGDRLSLNIQKKIELKPIIKIRFYHPEFTLKSNSIFYGYLINK
jgi:hypothetical protein